MNRHTVMKQIECGWAAAQEVDHHASWGAIEAFTHGAGMVAQLYADYAWSEELLLLSDVARERRHMCRQAS